MRGVRIVENKPAVHHLFFKVECCAIEIDVALRIANHTNAEALEFLVHVVLCLGEIQRIVEAAATSAADAEAQIGRLGG